MPIFSSLRKYYILIVCLFFLACQSKDPIATAEKIKLNLVDPNSVMDFSKRFASSEVIALETTKNSLIGEINRIYLYNGRIYLLDRSTNSVLIFNRNGTYITKLHAVGSGKGKYIGIMDFTIDEAGKKIIIHSHRPYKIIYYDLDGTFVSEVLLKNYFHNIGVADNKLITVNSSEDEEFLAALSNFDNSGIEPFIKRTTVSEMFKSFSTIFPNILSSKKKYITFPYSSTVYKYEKNRIIPAYDFDFGQRNMPDSILNKNLTASEIYNVAMKNDYGFFITNFRETNDFLIFSYGKGSIVIYSKKDRTTECFNFVKNDQELINFENLFGHDGDDDYILSVKEAINFKDQMLVYRSDAKSWAKVPAHAKHIDSVLNDKSNPVLILYKLKSK
ncbi:6-bladed beta-propeller [Pedobacter miscanthi]|nr:6-bladed beta-propeller [Pedobacter miscanthi]